MAGINLSTTNYRLENANRLINNIATTNNYFFFYGSFLPQSNASLQSVYDITSNVYTQAWNNMIAGKQISSNNVYNMISNVQWVANTVYAQYDDIDPNLPTKQFFVITTEGSFNHVWKILYNNFSVASTNQPLIAQASSTPYYQTADGYRWKYMATTPSYIGNLYQTSNYFPLIANTTVQAAAIPGSINAFLLSGNGAFYNNSLLGTFFTSDINVNGSLVQYNLSNTVASQVNGYYTGCLLYITGGSGAGQYATITSYTSNTTGNIITLSNALFPNPQNGTTYEINPQVTIASTGQQTVNCVAIAWVNALASNSVSSIQVIQPGAGYITIANAYIAVNAAVGIMNNAILRAVLPPQNGHGSNAAAELYSNSVGITVNIANSENGTVLTQNDYQQIGILKNPQFANVNLQFSNTSGTFLLGEKIYSFTPSQINANVVMTLGSTNISCNTANMVNQVITGQMLYMSGTSGSQLVQVNSIANSSTISVTSPALFSCSQSTMYSTVLTGNAVVTNVNSSNSIMVTNCTGVAFQTGTIIGGFSSGITGYLNTVVRNGLTEFFQTFVELAKYNATTLNGVFQINEQVQQGNNTAYLYGVTGVASIVMYLSNFVGGPFTTGTVTGLTSGAAATITLGYQPDLVIGSGKILFLENILPVIRSNNQTEQFNIVWNF